MEVSPIDEVDILRVTVALGCNGDGVAVTVATQPSLEGCDRRGHDEQADLAAGRGMPTWRRRSP